MRLATGTLLLSISLAACGSGEAVRAVDTTVEQVEPAIAERVRRLAAPSVVSVIGLQFDGSTAQHVLSGQGSAVTVASRVFLTDCRNIVGADRLILQQGPVREIATLADDYVGDDVCILASADLPGTPVLAIRDVASIQPGETAFAVGDPMGRGTTVAETAVTAVRENPYGLWIDTTLAMSPDLAGAGLFDLDGAFIGIAGTATDHRQVAALAIATPTLTELAGRLSPGPAFAVVTAPLIEPAAGPGGSIPRGAANLSAEEQASLERFFAERDGGDSPTAPGPETRTDTPPDDAAPGPVGDTEPDPDPGTPGTGTPGTGTPGTDTPGTDTPGTGTPGTGTPGTEPPFRDPNIPVSLI